MKALIDSVVKELEVSKGKAGMFLIHVGIVREFSKTGKKVKGMRVSWDREKLKEVISSVERMNGIEKVSVLINEGNLSVGDVIMVAGVSGRFRKEVIPALEKLVEEIKTKVIKEEEF
jgi:molybdopterin synthase catalytic subunit